MFGKKDDLEKEMQKAESETISSIIDKTMSITGEITFKGKTRIDGTINGNVSGEHLVLSESGKIVGDLKVSSFICNGSINGNIKANIVTARKGCSIHGRLEAGNLTVEPGAILDGEVKAATRDLHLVSAKSGDETVEAKEQNS
jgi:cytoskeletal protein CcmA (bactofilin family)